EVLALGEAVVATLAELLEGQVLERLEERRVADAVAAPVRRVVVHCGDATPGPDRASPRSGCRRPRAARTRSGADRPHGASREPSSRTGSPGPRRRGDRSWASPSPRTSDRRRSARTSAA